MFVGHKSGAKIEPALLISEVQKHEVLWNRKLNKDPLKMAEAWEAVAKKTGYTELYLKTKWKNLKDTFIKEIRIRSFPVDGSLDSMENPRIYTGKWVYFDSMSFMAPNVTPLTELNAPLDFKDELSGRPSRRRPRHITQDPLHIRTPNQITEDPTFSRLSHNLRRENSKMEVVLLCDEDDQEQLIKEESQDSVHVYHNDSDTVNVTDSNADADSISIPSPVDIHRPPSKRSRTHQTTPTSSPHKTEEEDMNYFKSLVPYMKKLSDVQKLRVRNEFQSILIRELSKDE